MQSNGTPIPDVTLNVGPDLDIAADTGDFDDVEVSVEDTLITDPLIASSGGVLHNFTDHERPGTRERVIAACRSLGAIGYADTAMSQINRVQHSGCRWIRSIQRVIEAPACQLLFPGGTPTLQQLHRLAILHDKPVRPPKRFVCGVHGAHAKRRAPYTLRQAILLSHKLEQELALHAHWLRPNLPQTEATVEQLKLLLDRRLSTRWSLRRLRAARAFKPYIRHGHSLARVIVSGNLGRLCVTLDKVCRFADHEHFSRVLGPAFRGIDSAWRELAVQIGFSQSLLDIVQQPSVAARLVTHWHMHAEDVYALARLASPASRRGRKLSRLANRLYEVGSSTEHLLLSSQKSVERLSLWVNLIQSSEPELGAYDHLSPRQILQRLMPSPLDLDALEEFAIDESALAAADIA